MKTFKFSLVLRTRENTDVFITLDDNIYGIHSKRVNFLYITNFVVVSSVGIKMVDYACTVCIRTDRLEQTV